MKSIRFLTDFFAVDGTGNRFVKYAQGSLYPVDAETSGQVLAGNAEEVDVPDESTAPTTPVEPASVVTPEAA